jgi:hypothetical protein
MTKLRHYPGRRDYSCLEPSFWQQSSSLRFAGGCSAVGSGFRGVLSGLPFLFILSIWLFGLLVSVMTTGHNHCIQATPGYVLGEFVALVPGAPDAEH